jgi:hypothetical protein
MVSSVTSPAMNNHARSGVDKRRMAPFVAEGVRGIPACVKGTPYPSWQRTSLRCQVSLAAEWPLGSIPMLPQCQPWRSVSGKPEDWAEVWEVG